MLVYRKPPSCHITITFPRTSSIITLKSSSRVCTENCGKSAKSLHQMLWGVFLWEVARPLCVMLLRAWNVISLSLVEQLSSARQEFPCCQPQKTTHTHTEQQRHFWCCRAKSAAGSARCARSACWLAQVLPPPIIGSEVSKMPGTMATKATMARLNAFANFLCPVS